MNKEHVTEMMRLEQAMPRWTFKPRKTILAGAVALIASLLAVHPQTPARASEFISRDELRADLEQTYELLKSRHPNLNTHTSRKDMDALYQRLLDEAEEANTPLKAYGVLTELIGAVCDEHTMVRMDRGTLSTWPQGWPWFDYPLMVDGGKLYMQPNGYRIKAEVLSIGGLKGPDIAAGLAARYPSDGCLGDGMLLVNGFLPVSGNIVAGMIGEKGPYVVKSLAPGSSKARTRLVSGYDRFNFSRDNRQEQRMLFDKVRNGLQSLGFQRLNLGPDQRLAGLDYWYSHFYDMAYIGLDSFKAQDKAAKGIDLVMRDIIKRNPEALVIDLVDNGGGSTKTAQTLMAFLLPRAHRLHERAYVKNVSKNRPENFEFFDEEAEKLNRHNVRFFSKRKSKRGIRSAPVAKKSFGKPDYKGQIYVLLSPTSRSNSIKVATNLKRLRDATIVGGVTATDTVTYCPRADGAFKLEHTKFSLHIPELCFRSPGNRLNEAATLVPDIPVNARHTPFEDLNMWTIKAAIDDHRGVATN